MSDTDLFGNEIDVFKTALDRYGVWPVTVWDCDKSDRMTQRLKKSMDDGKGREGCWNTSQSGGLHWLGANRHATVNGTYGYQSGASIFDPAVAAWLLNCYAPKDGLCFDPFAGGGTRAIMAAKHGMRYVGIELRREEVEAVARRLVQTNTSGAMCVQGDARDCRKHVSDASADFLITCPPYYDLERYDGGPADLSMCKTYAEFLDGLRQVVAETYRILKPGANACWVVGLHRDAAGGLLAIHHDLARMHVEQGFRFKEEIILAHRNNGAIQRVGNFDKGDRRLIRTHEYALVFVR
jgi:DNA modification methylase